MSSSSSPSSWSCIGARSAAGVEKTSGEPGVVGSAAPVGVAVNRCGEESSADKPSRSSGAALTAASPSAAGEGLADHARLVAVQALASMLLMTERGPVSGEALTAAAAGEPKSTSVAGVLGGAAGVAASAQGLRRSTSTTWPPLVAARGPGRLVTDTVDASLIAGLALCGDVAAILAGPLGDAAVGTGVAGADVGVGIMIDNGWLTAVLTAGDVAVRAGSTAVSDSRAAVAAVSAADAVLTASEVRLTIGVTGCAGNCVFTACTLPLSGSTGSKLVAAPGVPSPEPGTVAATAGLAEERKPPSAVKANAGAAPEPAAADDACASAGCSALMLSSSGGLTGAGCSAGIAVAVHVVSVVATSAEEGLLLARALAEAAPKLLAAALALHAASACAAGTAGEGAGTRGAGGVTAAGCIVAGVLATHAGLLHAAAAVRPLTPVTKTDARYQCCKSDRSQLASMPMGFDRFLNRVAIAPAAGAANTGDGERRGRLLGDRSVASATLDNPACRRLQRRLRHHCPGESRKRACSFPICKSVLWTRTAFTCTTLRKGRACSRPLHSLWQTCCIRSRESRQLSLD